MEGECWICSEHHELVEHDERWICYACRVDEDYKETIIQGPIHFMVIDKQTGIAPDVEKIALTEDWARDLVYCDMEGFLIGEEGTLYLADECGNMHVCPEDRFTVIWRKG